MGPIEGLVGSLVELVWDDAQFWGFEVEPEALSDESVMHTFGRIVRDTDRSLYIASEVQTEPETASRAVTRVPWGMVLDIRILSDITPAAPPRPGRHKVFGQNGSDVWHDPTCTCGAVGLA